MRILIVKTSSLGDVIHTLPAVTDAARALEGARFDWVVEEAFAEIPAWHPAVEEVIPVALRRWRKTPFAAGVRREWRQFRKALGKHHYDAVIDAQGLLKSAMLARLVEAPRYGLDRHSARERWASTVYHHPIAVARDKHAVERIRALFAEALGYPVPPGRGDYGVRANLGASADLLPPSLLFFHGTARDEKLWPERHWLALGRQANDAGYKIWLPWGSDAEKARATRLADGLRNAEVLPRLSLAGLAAFLLKAGAAVAVDTGLAHLSAALDVPTVSLYGPTSVDLIGAYGDNQLHIQSPLSGDGSAAAEAMMAAIEPGAVWQALQTVLPDAGAA